MTPVYNEAPLIEASIGAIDSFLSRNFDDYEVLIVESGSTDGTAAICDRIAALHPQVRVIHEGRKNGWGSGLKLGYQSATKAILLPVAADLPFPLETIIRALPYFKQYDAVLSYRSRDVRPLWRRLRSFVYNAVVKGALGLRVRHVNSAFKAFRREVIKSLTLTSNSWFLDAELVFRLEQRGIHYAEIPVELLDRTAGHSSITAGTPLSLIKELYAFRRKECQ